MPFNRTSSCVALGLLLSLLAAPSYGQGPLGFQIFAPADVSTFGGEPEPNEGYFFSFDGLWWSISAPKRTPIGYDTTRVVYYGPNDTDARVERNTLDTSQMKAQFSAGNRIEFGRVEDRNGWFVSIFQQRNQDQNFAIDSADIVFNDPKDGPAATRLLQGNVNSGTGTAVIENLPVTLYNVNMKNSLSTWGVELNYLHRFMTGHSGGTFEMFLGARYFEFNDYFDVTTGDGPDIGTVPSFLAGSWWFTGAQNHIVGPQIGLRWFKKQGRWMFSTEGRFMAGMNCQNVHQSAQIGPQLDPGSGDAFTPTTMSPTASSSSAYAKEFSPFVELRVEGRYQITRAISFHAGWSGMWMAGIARASSLVDYTVPGMGIDMTNNREDLFLNGLQLGFDVNR